MHPHADSPSSPLNPIVYILHSKSTQLLYYHSELGPSLLYWWCVCQLYPHHLPNISLGSPVTMDTTPTHADHHLLQHILYTIDVTIRAVNCVGMSQETSIIVDLSKPFHWHCLAQFYSHGINIRVRSLLHF